MRENRYQQDGLKGRIFRLMMLAYPESFREHFEEGMFDAFSREWAERRRRGTLRLLLFCARSLASALVFGARAHLSGPLPEGATPEVNWRRLRPLRSWDSTVLELWRDVRFGFRRLAKTPRFTLVTVLTLGLGIGANTALFSVVHSVLLSPLPYQDSDQLVFAWETRNEGSRRQQVSPGNFESWRAGSTTFQGMAAFRYAPFNVTGGETPYRADGLEMSADMLSLLGVRPHLGREFSPQDEKPGAESVCMVSHSFWVDRLGSDPDLAEARLTLNGRSYAVVGVLPQGFAIPGFGSRPIYTPLPLDPGHSGYWGNHNARVLARLADGVQIQQANEEVSVIASRLAESHPAWNQGVGARLVPALQVVVQGSQGSLTILFGTVVFVLLIACVNVASLLLARAAAAEEAMAVRVALGAHRSRIVRLVLAEAVLLSGAGGALGLVLGYWGVSALRSWGPGAIPRLSEVAVNQPVLWFTLLCAVGTGLLFGLAPALRSSRVDIRSALVQGGRSAGLASRHRVQRGFVVAEIAMAVVLLNCSGLLVKTFTNLLEVDPGFEPEGRVAMQVTLPRSRYSDPDQVSAFLERLEQNLEAIPGVMAAGSSVGLPFHWMTWRVYMTVEGDPASTLPEVPLVDVSVSSPGYMETMGVSLLSGRSISETDDAESPLVAVVNEAFIRRNLPGQDPMGHRFRFGLPDALRPADQTSEDRPWYTIVGVVGDVRRWNLATEAIPEAFVTHRQYKGGLEYFAVVHTSLPAENVADAMRQAIWDINPDQPVAWVQPMESLYSTMVAQPRLNATLVGLFGLSALILAMAGIYGLMANTVSARAPEIGLRIALGAKPGQVLRHIVAQGTRSALLGIVIGLTVSVAATRLLSTIIFGVQPIDPPTMALAVSAVLIVAAAAAWGPSWRATRLDATEALAAE